MAALISRELAQQIVDTVKDVCERDINFIEPSGIIFASTDAKRIGDFHEIGKKAAALGKIIEVEKDDIYLGTNRGINLPISYNQEIIAVVGITGVPKEIRKFARLAEQVTRLLIREHELSALSKGETDRKHYVLDCLIHNKALSDEYLEEKLKEWHIFKETNKRVVIIQVESKYNPLNLSMLEQKIAQFYARVDIHLSTYYYPNTYIALIEATTFLQKENLFKEFVETYNPLLKIAVGKGESFERIAHSYQSAQLTYQSILLTKKQYALFDELDLEIILSCIDEKRRQEYLDKVGQKLSKEDFEILSVYYEENMSLKQTCHRLFLHKNTLQYKLDRIQRICGKNPRCFQDAVKLYLALQLIEK